jgi:hypothetical protein
MSNRFVKIGADGAALAAEASEWSAVLDETTGLIWDAGEHKALTWKKALEFPKTLAIAGFSDWRLPTVEELFLLADRTKRSPAIDAAFFPKCTGGWYWTSTVEASSPGVFVWGVFFDSGRAYCGRQGYKGLVRACAMSNYSQAQRKTKLCL